MLYILLVLSLVGVDQATKWWIVENFSMYESREIIPAFFNLTYITNSGSAFGFLSGEYNLWRQVFFVTVAVLALSFMAYTFKQLKEQGNIFAVAICMIAAGAIGNLIDRVRLGAVVDFLDFYIKNSHWPAFNVADSAITVGVALFLIGNLMQKSEE